MICFECLISQVLYEDVSKFLRIWSNSADGQHHSHCGEVRYTQHWPCGIFSSIILRIMPKINKHQKVQITTTNHSFQHCQFLLKGKELTTKLIIVTLTKCWWKKLFIWILVCHHHLQVPNSIKQLHSLGANSVPGAVSHIYNPVRQTEVILFSRQTRELGDYANYMKVHSKQRRWE